MVEVYAKGRRVPFQDISVDWSDLTEFRQEVLQACRSIPYGQTRTYKELAEQVGRPNSVRSIGTCMAANPIPIIVPCHRVVASDGSLGGYSAPGGTEMKSLLLQMERETVAAAAK
jgi:methylated-DNA-[protein]-cysteine S-methyltransferase